MYSPSFIKIFVSMKAVEKSVRFVQAFIHRSTLIQVLAEINSWVFYTCSSLNCDYIKNRVVQVSWKFNLCTLVYCQLHIVPKNPRIHFLYSALNFIVFSVDGQEFQMVCEDENVTEYEYIRQIIYEDAEQHGPQKRALRDSTSYFSLDGRISLI